MAALLMCAAPAYGGEIRYHGFKFDDKNRLLIEEENGVIRLGLLSRARVRGGGTIKRTGAPLSPEVSRYGDRRILARIYSEVLKSSEPNFLRNPGQRYRITIEGVELAPDHHVTFDVDAANARKAVYSEFEKLRVRALGAEREALWFGIPLVLGILNEAARVPADIPLSIENSLIGTDRLLDDRLQSRRPPGGRSLKPISPGELRRLSKDRAGKLAPDLMKTAK